MLVADQRNNHVAVFDSGRVASNFVHSFKVNNPNGLAIDCDGDTKLVHPCFFNISIIKQRFHIANSLSDNQRRFGETCSVDSPFNLWEQWPKPARYQHACCWFFGYLKEHGVELLI